MRRPDHRQVFDTESLQADVMRFMAIIAFVLIAILALVQKLEGPQPQTPVTASDETIVEPAMSAIETVPPKNVIPEPPVKTVKIVSAEPPAAPQEKKQQETHAPDDTPPVLTLRFSSDKAFLFLLGRETISLFGKHGTEFQRLSPGFELVSARLSGDLYEVMPVSLPRVVRRVFTRSNEAEIYLVSLPASIRADIDRLQAAHAEESGTLIINKDGIVHYEKT